MRATEIIFSSIRRLNAGWYLPVAVLFGIFAAQGNAAVTVSHLRCENLLDPQGIDASRPRLSWILDSSGSNEKQTAYEVVVDGQWDSGRVESDQSIQIQYGGKELAPATRYTWKVRVWDAEGKASEWSKSDTFSTGLKEWRAKWIGHDEAGNTLWQSSTSLWEDTHPLPARYLRREFAVTKKVTRATAYVCGLGFFDLYLNGAKVSQDVMDPALSEYDKAAYVVTFDVTDRLNTGANALGVILGNGRFYGPRLQEGLQFTRFGYPRLLLQLEVEYADGTKTTVVSDKSWRLTTEGPIRANNEYDGEEYDARMEMPGWDRAGFDDAKWGSAEIVHPPGGALKAQMIEPMMVTQIVHPVSITSPKPGTYIVDMGQNFYGTVRLKATAPRGTEVRMVSAYSLNADGTLKTADNRTALCTDVYTFKGEGVEVWNPVFKGQGFRRVQVTGFPGTPTMDNFEGLVIHTAVEPVGEFESSNELANRIHSALWWGTKMFLRSAPLDPDRDERMAWTGDPAKDAESEAYNFNVEPFYATWMDDAESTQRADGSLPDVTMYWLFGYGVEWPSVFTIIPDWMIDFYGDGRVAETHYAAMKKWVLAMRMHEVEDGTLEATSYRDWCDTYTIGGRIPDQGATPGELVSSAYQYHNERIMERLAKQMGHADDERTFRELADKLKIAFNKKFLDPQAHTYMKRTQTGYVLALAFGLAPADQRDAIAANLVDDIMVKHDGHLSVGLIGMQWLMQTLTDVGRPDVAWTIATQTTRPSWGYMLSKGATTIWERWDFDTRDPGMNSEALLIQAGNLDAWFYETLAGIRPAAPGFKRILIRPTVVGDLTWVKAHFDSPYGRIVSDWKIEGNQLTMDVTVPANTTATIVVPGKNGGTHKVGSGNYHFTSQGPKWN
jgi:alpha-L-rhamnosidase